ncbi:cistern family PEP-CTERM protein [Coleofasciculus sp. FACHB-1120]|nr:cistern family PEP-CTERM protein [Coleofasciculus sp. FACHB-1120]
MVQALSKLNIGLPVLSAIGSRSVSIFASVVVAAGIATASSAFSPAKAFTITTKTGANSTAGNPGGQQLYDVGITKDDIGNSFLVDWFLASGTQNTDGESTPVDLSATSIFKVLDFTQNLLSLEVNITNTTSANFQAAILSTGLSVTPNGSGSFATMGTGKVFDKVRAGNGPQQNYPGGFKGIDVCIYAANNCSGGNVKQGLQSGDTSDTFKLNITGNFGVDSAASLGSFPIKFQTENGSYELAGKPLSNLPKPVPEPATALALGFVAAGAARALKRKNVV